MFHYQYITVRPPQPSDLILYCQASFPEGQIGQYGCSAHFPAKYYLRKNLLRKMYIPHPNAEYNLRFPFSSQTLQNTIHLHPKD